MANILDYLKWRGDLSLHSSPFNEVDNLILARLSYFPFDNLFEGDTSITIKDAYERFKNYNIKDLHILQIDDLDLFPALACSPRFSDMIISNYINKVDSKEEKQFSAITIQTGDGAIYVSYRGTDNTLVGWKEDLNMSFMEKVPSQFDAVNYLENIASNFYGNIRVGGHSKGGNLAVFASAFCSSEVQDRIINVYNNDGPGFVDSIISSENYQKILDRISSYIPKTSIIGRLLNHVEKYFVVESTATGIMQHDLYSWQLIGKHFECLNNVTNGSVFIDDTISDWLASVSVEEREKLVDILFEILESTNAKTLAQISSKKFTNATIMLKSYKNVSPESKKIINKLLHLLFDMAKGNVKKDLLSK